jgi:hypothetical protein
MSTDALQVSIEQRLRELSDEAERLRAALDALGSDDTSGPTASRPRRTAPRAAPRHVVMQARADEQALSAGDVATATRLARSATTAEVASGGDRSLLGGDLADGVAREAAEAAAAGAPGGELATAMTGADRALQSLRRELAAGLRNSRR